MTDLIRPVASIKNAKGIITGILIYAAVRVLLSHVNIIGQQAYPPGLGDFNFIYFIPVIVALVVILTAIKSKSLDITHTGLTCDKTAYVSLALILIASLYFLFERRPMAFSFSLSIIPIILMALTDELIFRSTLINILILKFGNDKKGIALSLLTSAMVFSLILPPIPQAEPLSFGSQLIFSALYYFGGSILPTLFFNTNYFIPNERLAAGGVVIILSYFLIYFIAESTAKSATKSGKTAV